MTTKYDNADWSRCAGRGGVTLALIDAEGYGRGNDGISIPCRGCWVQARMAEGVEIKMNIGSKAEADLGVQLGDVTFGAQPLWVPISDVAQLYFYGIVGHIVDIMYLLG